MKRVLVTGGAGFVGRAILPSLTKKADEVHVCDRVVLSGLAEDVQWHTVDLLASGAGPELIRELQPTHLLHLAWASPHGKSWNDPINLSWVRASLGLIEAFAAAGGTRVITTGTCAEYDWRGIAPLDELDTPVRPATLYAASKAALHLIQDRFCANAGVSSAWARVFFLYGPGEPCSKLLTSVALSLAAEKPVELSNPGACYDFVHIDDVCGALIRLLETDVTGPVNIGTGTAHSVRTAARIMADLAGRQDLIRDAVSESRGIPTTVCANTTRLRQAGFVPSLTLEAGCQDLWNRCVGLSSGASSAIPRK